MPAPDTRRAALAQTRLQSELWHARQQSAQLCRELRALSTAEPRPAAPRHDLAFLMPGHSLWVWEAYDAPELVPAELEHFLRAHNANAARRPAPPAVAVDAWLAAQRASRAPFERAPQMLQSARSTASAPSSASRPCSMLLSAGPVSRPLASRSDPSFVQTPEFAYIKQNFCI